MSYRREIKILLTHKNFLLVKKKINNEGEIKYFLPCIPLTRSDQPVRVLQTQIFNVFHNVEMHLKSFFGKRTLKKKGVTHIESEYFPYHIDLTHQKNLDVLYDFLKKYNLENFNFLNFRWFEFSNKNLSLFNLEDKKIVEELSYRMIYGEEVLKNPIIKKFILNKKDILGKELF